MKILVAPDSYKGSATAAEVAAAMAEGLGRAWPEAVVDRIPMADGGTGFLEALLSACGGRFVPVRVADPLGRPVEAGFALLPDGTAAVEMALASGLPLLASEERDPLRTDSFGTGELIRAAVEAGAETILVGIGGSATNDGGVGTIRALGGRFLDDREEELSPGGAALADLARIDLSGLLPEIRDGRVRIVAACDVDNPLCGSRGASAVYGPQKGATPEMAERLDGALRRYADRAEATLEMSLRDRPGTGAAGGLGFGLALLGAEFEPGFDLVARATRLGERISEADWVLTGEGRTDAQTPFGKTVSGVVRLARSGGIPSAVLSGGLGEGAEILLDLGALALASVVPGPMSLEEAMADPMRLIRGGAERIGRWIRLGWKLAEGERKRTEGSSRVRVSLRDETRSGGDEEP
jgi:glycerate kinase